LLTARWSCSSSHRLTAGAQALCERFEIFDMHKPPAADLDAA